ncbi:LOW QUALITY PROTEIN: telomerase reverse transcriptase-like [Lepus europaeus]|uniref:LOW QUALITY PROTEIN: telomerase reverse transcriptase-like n=1 Tax=Lepus europaeus TaxID=9983 RepID=UPI002B476F7D|nr:LOW QUALITY PROTEIN: telomerase reverse transcriptase-like [Lepus europaeus]
MFMLLLVHYAFYLLVAPSCPYQVCGPPLYELGVIAEAWPSCTMRETQAGPAATRQVPNSSGGEAWAPLGLPACSSRRGRVPACAVTPAECSETTPGLPREWTKPEPGHSATRWSPHPQAQVYVEPKRFLYYLGYGERLHTSFPLSSLRPSLVGAWRLLEAIFLGWTLRPGGSRSPRQLLLCYWKMRPMFRKPLANHTRCPYGSLLRMHCLLWGPAMQVWSPRPAADPQEDTGSRRLAHVRLLQQHSSPWQVHAFLRACLRRLVTPPPGLWGSRHNKLCFPRNTKKFILLGKHAKLSLQELTWKVRVQDCTWLLVSSGRGHIPTMEHRLREGILARFLFWLLDTYVVGLLRSFFYVMETTFQKNQLLFYRRSVWAAKREHQVPRHLEQVQLRKLSDAEVQQQARSALPMTRLRFIPKPSGLQPIVNPSSVVGVRMFRREKAQPWTLHIRTLFSVLNYERVQRPSLLGASVLGLGDVHQEALEAAADPALTADFKTILD